MQALSVTSSPEFYFAESHRIVVPGSHIWLYCDVDSTSLFLTVEWYKNNVRLYQDAPHILMRQFASNTDTTLMFAIHNFQQSDNGVYQCIASEGGGILSSVKGKELALTGILLTKCLYVIVSHY